MKAISNYFRSAYDEMRKVTWPTKKETYNFTVLVIAISIIMALFLGGLDFLFSRGLEQLITR